MKKSYILLIMILCGFNSHAQNGFLGGGHTFSISNNVLTIYQGVSFSFGSGSACPPLVSHQINIVGGTITVDVLYDLRGAYPTYFCSRIDTLFNVYSGNFDTLIVNAHAKVNSWPDTILMDQDTSYNSIVSLQEDNIYKGEVKLYPLPANEIIHIRRTDQAALRQITLLNLQGQIVKEYDASLRALNVAELPSGIYFLRMVSDVGQVQKKVLIE